MFVWENSYSFSQRHFTWIFFASMQRCVWSMKFIVVSSWDEIRLNTFKSSRIWALSIQHMWKMENFEANNKWNVVYNIKISRKRIWPNLFLFFIVFYLVKWRWFNDVHKWINVTSCLTILKSSIPMQYIACVVVLWLLRCCICFHIEVDYCCWKMYVLVDACANV